MTKQEENIEIANWFDPKQVSVINSNSAIRNNIGDLVSQLGFGNISKVNDSKYLIVGHIKEALNYVYSLKIKVGDNFSNKINGSFYQATIFDKPSGENLIFCNLLLSDGKLKIAIEQIKRNLENKEIIVENDSQKPSEYYQFLLYISDIKLKILQENDNSTTKQLNNVFNNFSFRQKIPFQYFESTATNIGEQPQGRSEKENNLKIANKKPFVEQQPNFAFGGQAGGNHQIGGKNLGSNANVTYELPAIIQEKADKLVEALNDGARGKNSWNNLKGSEIIFPKDDFEPFYLLEVERGEDKMYNLLDNSGDYVISPNWRIIPHIAEDLKNKLKEIELQNAANQLRTLFYLVQDCETANEFLAKIREENFPKTFLQNTFEVNDTLTRVEKIAKFEAWFTKYKNQEIEDNKPEIGEIISTERIEIVPIEPIEPIERNVPQKTRQIPVQNLNQNQERFYLPETDNNFKVSKKLIENFEALIVLENLLSENRIPDEIDKETLAKYVGFGSLKDILLDPTNDTHWDKSNEANREFIQNINSSISKIESFGYIGALDAVKDSIHNAHYTSDTVINAIYKGINQLGFKSGKILEPSAGIGNFIGFMPEDMRKNSNITQIEIEPITSLINTYLYSDTKVVNQPLQNAGLKNESFDLVISNIPFGDYRVFDKNFKGDLAQFQNRIHNYFFAKALNLTREGGIIAFVTSKGVFDSASNKNLRTYIEQNSDFLGAFRLPNSTFKNAGTSVVTDIIFLQKTAPKDLTESIILNTLNRDITDKDGIPVTISINEYFVKNPQNVFGTIKLGGMYSANDFTITGPASNLEVLGKQILATLPINVYQVKDKYIADNENINEILANNFSNIKIGSIGIYEKEIYRKIGAGEFEKVKTKDNIKKVAAYLEIKDNLMELIGLEYQNSNKLEVNVQREKLHALHKYFINNYGQYEKSLQNLIKIDSDIYNVLALTDAKGINAKILSEPTITPLKLINNTNNIDEAILISLYENNKIDVNRIAVLMDTTDENVLDLAQGKIFLEESSQQYIHHVEYLSGNVKAKLKEVTQLINDGNTAFQSNLEALGAVIPKDIPTSMIEARMGSRWIDVIYYNEFIVDLLKSEDVSIHYNKSIDEYNVMGKNRNLLTINQFGTGRISAVDLIQLALHIQQPIIRDLVSTDPDKYQVNRVETAKAIEKWT